MIFQDESNNIILYIHNPYILVYSSGKSCVSKTSIKNSTPYILGWREYKTGRKQNRFSTRKHCKEEEDFTVSVHSNQCQFVCYDLTGNMYVRYRR
jgi:hypothetical protein